MIKKNSLLLENPIFYYDTRWNSSTLLAEHTLAREELDQALEDQVRARPPFSEGIAAFCEKRQPRYP